MGNEQKNKPSEKERERSCGKVKINARYISTEIEKFVN